MSDFENDLRSIFGEVDRERQTSESEAEMAAQQAHDHRERQMDIVRAAAAGLFQTAKSVLAERDVRVDIEEEGMSLVLRLTNRPQQPYFFVQVRGRDARLAGIGAPEHLIALEELSEDVVRARLTPWLRDAVEGWLPA